MALTNEDRGPTRALVKHQFLKERVDDLARLFAYASRYYQGRVFVGAKKGSDILVIDVHQYGESVLISDLEVDHYYVNGKTRTNVLWKGAVVLDFESDAAPPIEDVTALIAMVYQYEFERELNP